MTLFAIGLNHKTTHVELREQLAIRSSQLVSAASEVKLHGGLDEIVLLSTCNRVEIYGTTQRSTTRLDSLFEAVGGATADYRSHVYVHQNIEAARHLFRVAAGLDSLVLGETEITGQVKNAYKIAHASGLTGRSLNRTFQKAFHAVKEIRTRTGIGRGSTSVGSVAVELAERIFANNLWKQTVIIIGAGRMGETCVRQLAKKGVRSILVSNRSFDRAAELADEFRGRALHLEDGIAAIANADIVVTSTGCPKTVLHRTDLEKLMVARRNRPLILIDISVPRNVDASVQSLDNVYLYNIDDLEAIVRENVRNREQELALCHQIIEARVAGLMEKLSSERPSLYDLSAGFQASWLSQSAAVGG